MEYDINYIYRFDFEKLLEFIFISSYIYIEVLYFKL